MMTLFEVCAGSAAFSCWAWGGKPPTSYMGSKAGYAAVLGSLLGVRRGSCPRVILAEPGPYGAVWRVLSQPGQAQAVADIIRGWEGEEPRALWMRLRDEWRVDPELRGPREVARSMLMDSWSRPGNPGSSYYGPGATDGGTWGQEARDRALSLERLATSVESVARWLVLASWSYRHGDVESGFNPSVETGLPVTGTCHGANPRTVEAQRGIIESAARPAGWTVYDRAQDVPIPEDASDFVIYADPSYRRADGKATTGYAENVYAEDLAPLLLECAARGAFVAVSDARPLDHLFPGWHVRDIARCRKGQARTFGATPEFLTMSRAPVNEPPYRGEQVGLFG